MKKKQISTSFLRCSGAAGVYPNIPRTIVLFYLYVNPKSNRIIVNMTISILNCRSYQYCVNERESERRTKSERERHRVLYSVRLTLTSSGTKTYAFSCPLERSTKRKNRQILKPLCIYIIPDNRAADRYTCSRFCHRVGTPHHQ